MNTKEYVPDDSVYIADGAVVRGNVTIGSDSAVWFGAVVRAEDTSITIGQRSNVQDNCVLHVDPWTNINIGDDVTIGHGAIIHGCTIGDNSLIGMGAIIMNDAHIGRNCIIGAGALVTERTEIPDGSLVIGSPAKVKRACTEEEIEHIHLNAAHYVEMAKEYKQASDR